MLLYFDELDSFLLVHGVVGSLLFQLGYLHTVLCTTVASQSSCTSV